MAMFLKQLILALVIVVGGVFVWGLYYEYGLAYGLTPPILGGSIYIAWQAYKRRNPSAKEVPEMPTFDKIFKKKKK